MTSNDSELEVYNLTIGIAGSICAPIVFALLVVMVCAFRAFKTTFQRLILYQILIALLSECSCAFQVQIDSPHPRWLCVTAMYLYLYCIISWFICTAAVTNYGTCFCSPSDCSEEIPTSGSMVNLPNASVFSCHLHYLLHTCGYQFVMVAMQL